MPKNANELSFLVVDDMLTMRKIVGKELKSLGVTQIVEAENGAVAWQKLVAAKEAGKPIQFIVSDWNMPEMMGIDLLSHCRKDPVYKSVAFLMVTAETEVTQVSEAIASGVDSYVVKPFTPASFLEKLNVVLKKRFP